MKRLTILIFSLGLLAVAACDLQTQLCPQLADWSTSDLIEELISRGLDVFDGD